MNEIKIGDVVEVKIEKLVHEGAGLAKLNGLSIFIESCTPEDIVKAEIISVNKNYAKAKLVEITTPSPHRIKPECAMANICGGCQWAHVDYQCQLAQKRQIIQDAMKSILGEHIEVKQTIPSPDQKQFRHKIQFPVSQTINSKRFLVGYYKKRTHELVNIKYCPNQPEIINTITQDIRDKAQELGITAYDEKKKTGELRHIVFRFSNEFQNGLLTLVINSETPSNNIIGLISYLYNKYSALIGCLVNFNTKNTNVILGIETKLLEGQDFYTEKIGYKTYEIGATSFFQVNPKAAANIFNVVKKMILENCSEKPTILDAYCGVGALGLYLFDIASEVFCVEQHKQAASYAERNAQLNNAHNVSVFTGDVEQQFEEFKKYDKKFDVVILDPPRKGSTEKSLDDIIGFEPETIIYINCNPATLARDLKYLHQNGYQAQYIQPCDMFCNTYHIESVALIKRVR